MGSTTATATSRRRRRSGRSSPDLQGDQILTDAGFHNSTERDSVRKQFNMTKVVEEAKKDPRIAAAVAEAEARNADFTNSLVGRKRAAENEEYRTTVVAGMTGEALKNAKIAARARLIDAGMLKPRGVMESLADSAKRLAGSAGGTTGEDLAISGEAFRELRRQGRDGRDRCRQDIAGAQPGRLRRPVRRLLLPGRD